MLSLARAGELPFFLIASLAVACWTTSIFNRRTAVLAVLVFTNLPPVLAHAGLATTDIAATAAYIVLLHTSCQWLDGPSLKTAICLGLALGFAITAKFSIFVFFMVAAPLVLITFAFTHKGRPFQWRRRAAQIGLVFSIAFVCTWAIYRFSWGPLPYSSAVELLHSPWIQLTRALGQTPIPAPQAFTAFLEVLRHNEVGHAAYLLGRVRQMGTPLFFPAVFFYKTPIAVLALMLVGLVLTLRRRRSLSWQVFVPIIGILAVFLPSITSHLNLGIRHILPVYPLVAMIAAASIVELLSSDRGLVKAGGALCLIWLLVASVRSHPEYLAYFNEFAGDSPELVRTDSDLDWGQDLAQLAATLKSQQINEPIGLAYFGTAIPGLFGIDALPLDPCHPRSGWIAISLSELTPQEATRKCGGEKAWFWLRKMKVEKRVGSSIWLLRQP